ncbi:unnamed protein product [Fusarium venenatum]|uniref:Uncharacterized protein n=1 Tax=Fusarium venenatum TaxID=56646 RepID=A0A2L2TSC2_9HYPO|nr:uncharacterized protein FVRRES_03198 [Fusarium venenatum]CEI66686.1 unnamed protein product [Fusarium venenatum]
MSCRRDASSCSFGGVMLALQEDKNTTTRELRLSCSVEGVSTAKSYSLQTVSTDGLSSSKVARVREGGVHGKGYYKDDERKNLVSTMQARPRKSDRWIPNSGKVL